MSIFASDQWPVSEIVNTLAPRARYSRDALVGIMWASMFAARMSSSKPASDEVIARRMGHVDRQIKRMIRAKLIEEHADGTYSRLIGDPLAELKHTFVFRGVTHTCLASEYADTVAALQAATPEAVQAERIERLEREIAQLKESTR